MRVRWLSHGGETAQSVVETALVVPFLIVLALCFAGAILLLDATSELRSATGLATSSAFSAPVGATQQALHNINDTFQRSVHSTFIAPGSLQITCPPGEANQYLYNPAYAPNTVVSCHGSATVSFANSVIGLIWRWDVHLQQDAKIAVPPFRQCAPGVSC